MEASYAELAEQIQNVLEQTTPQSWYLLNHAFNAFYLFKDFAPPHDNSITRIAISGYSDTNNPNGHPTKEAYTKTCTRCHDVIVTIGYYLYMNSVNTPHISPATEVWSYTVLCRPCYGDVYAKVLQGYDAKECTLSPPTLFRDDLLVKSVE